LARFCITRQISEAKGGKTIKYIYMTKYVFNIYLCIIYKQILKLKRKKKK